MISVVKTGIAASKAPVSGTVRAGNIVYSVHVSKDPETGAVVTGDIETQTRRALTNLKMAMEAAGGSLANVAQMTIYLIDDADAPGMNTAYREIMPEPYPVRATVVVNKLLGIGTRIELVAMAVI
ncbi:RidA family protein [Ferrovibrio sp.]|uniref:RidA family protein n=1 Tax=Ferrovibrio sp. TaxID=1917215 RepID=UPI0025BEC7A5|nr:RidA family protein [Ferrovibrio sp.]MBX3454645.1 RidA family protein [Ferrovibrio sp.]